MHWGQLGVVEQIQSQTQITDFLALPFVLYAPMTVMYALMTVRTGDVNVDL